MTINLILSANITVHINTLIILPTTTTTTTTTTARRRTAN